MSDNVRRLPAKVVPAETPGLHSLLTLAACVVAVAALYLAREVLIPITLAILLSFVLAPVVDMLRRIRIPHAPAVILAVMIGLGVILSIGGVIGVQIASLATEVPRYTATIETKIGAVRGATLGRLSSLMQKLDRQMGRGAPGPSTTAPATSESQPGPNAPPTLGKGPQAVPVEIQQPAAQPLDILRAVLAPVVEPVSNLFIIIIIAIFVLMQREDLRDRLIRLFGSSDLHRTTVALDDAARRLGRYFLSQLGINASFGLIVALGLWLIGVPSPVLWGVTGALLRFVPYVGPVIAGLLPAAVAAAVFPGWSMVAWTVGLFVAVEAVTGQVIEPMVYGHSTGLSPAAVVIAAIFWTWIWGPIGLVLSTPLTLCLVVLGRHVDRLEFLDVMLGDRPALTPVENFYQRMLAQDTDEALHQAELLLKERPLTAYYDEVALKGLQLAANDALRGVLASDTVESIKRSVMALVEDLAEYDDVDPHPIEKADAAAVATKAERALPSPPAPRGDAPGPEALPPGWQGQSPVLCLAGRGPLDEAASAMLAQLLGKHGLHARIAAHEAASREGISSLDLGGVAMVCISYLEIADSPTHLHYLLRRLRRKAPGLPLLVGLWPMEDEPAGDTRARQVIGADHYTHSMKEAVEACLAEAHRGAGTPARDAPPVAPEAVQAATPADAAA
ncbi:MAG TPA: AI-2E family transporter [Lichenihabitans sp.]|jgi:predicted PurR-regulated permease PerM|nr:AI-2E family transporter [Lichenihabitans sp.]